VSLPAIRPKFSNPCLPSWAPRVSIMLPTKQPHSAAMRSARKPSFRRSALRPHAVLAHAAEDGLRLGDLRRGRRRLGAVCPHVVEAGQTPARLQRLELEVRDREVQERYDDQSGRSSHRNHASQPHRRPLQNHNETAQ
jgi:hypothetical protein